MARRHGLATVWITCNPDNRASRRTCELTGAQLVEIVDLPADNDKYRAASAKSAGIGCSTLSEAHRYRDEPVLSAGAPPSGSFGACSVKRQLETHINDN